MNKVAIIAGSLLLACSAAAYSQAISDPVKEAQRLTRVAQVAQQQGRYDDAIKAYETIGVIAKSSPKIAAAARSFRASLSLDPSSAEAQNNLGEALGELKQYQSALGAFQQAVSLD